MSFSVLNPGGRDPDQTFPAAPGKPDDPGHPPVNYHAYAACRNGGFYRDEKSVPAGPALVLLRKRNLRRALAAVAVLRKRGCKVFVSCKESGSHQIADLLGDVSRWELFQEICASSDGAISSTPSSSRFTGRPGVPLRTSFRLPIRWIFPHGISASRLRSGGEFLWGRGSSRFLRATTLLPS
jgi:hypothetical protein